MAARPPSSALLKFGIQRRRKRACVSPRNASSATVARRGRALLSHLLSTPSGFAARVLSPHQQLPTHSHGDVLAFHRTAVFVLFFLEVFSISRLVFDRFLAATVFLRSHAPCSPAVHLRSRCRVNNTLGAQSIHRCPLMVSSAFTW